MIATTQETMLPTYMTGKCPMCGKSITIVPTLAPPRPLPSSSAAAWSRYYARLHDYLSGSTPVLYGIGRHHTDEYAERLCPASGVITEIWVTDERVDQREPQITEGCHERHGVSDRPAIGKEAEIRHSSLMTRQGEVALLISGCRKIHSIAAFQRVQI